jgi:transcriptional regulator with XRE-family HTH domain
MHTIKTKPMTFGELIRDRRRQLDLTQEEVAREIETSIPYIGLLESDKRRPSDAIVSKLADVLGLDRGELFFMVNPAAKELLQSQQTQAANSAWEEFRNDERLRRVHKITPQELEILSRVALMGEVRTVRDFVYILNTVRQALAA